MRRLKQNNPYKGFDAEEKRTERMISCIVTTYKRPVGILKRALDSVINQTCRDTEIIVVNDAPQDEELVENIRELLNGYSKEIQYIVPKQSQGACGARNLGLQRAKGEYVAFLDDDDEWLPEKLERQLEQMRKKDVALVYCSHYLVDNEGKTRLIEEPLAVEGIHKEAFEQLLRCNFIGSTSYPLLRTEVVKKMGGFAGDIESSQDHELWLRIAKEHSIFYEKEPLVKLYYSKESISRNRQKVLQGYDYLLNKYEAIYKQDRELLNYRLNYLAVACATLGFYDESIRYLARAIRVKPFCRNNVMLLGRVWRRLRK